MPPEKKILINVDVPKKYHAYTRIPYPPTPNYPLKS